jgi:hypothetical protein
MSNDVFALGVKHIRGTDSNSLLRLYDLACGTWHKSASHQEQAKADKAIRRIACELRRRDIPFTLGITPDPFPGEGLDRTSSTLTGK